jgi:molybdopterin-containing oxidoreductase family membrane subunit
MAKVTLATAMIVGYGYASEAFFGYFSADEYERHMIWNRMTGPYWPLYWTLILCNIITPQFLWSKKIRTSPGILWCISIVVNIGMWLERFVIVITSLHHDFLPSSWAMYWPTIWDWAVYTGTLGLFMTLIFLFVRVLPMITIFELRMLLPGAEVKEPVTQ